jgi:hypothetical protein
MSQQIILSLDEETKAIFRELIEALKSRRGGWGGKKGTDRGYFRTTPDLSKWEAGDSYHVVATSYSYNNEKQRCYFYSPYPDPNDETRAAYVASIAKTGKMWDKLLGNWQPQPRGEFSARRIRMQVAADKDDPTKKYSFMVAINELGQELDSVEWVE